MADWIRRIARPGAVAATILCLLFPLVWNRLFPAFEGDPANFQLTAVRPDDEIEVPESPTSGIREYAEYPAMISCGRCSWARRRTSSMSMTSVSGSRP